MTVDTDYCYDLSHDNTSPALTRGIGIGDMFWIVGTGLAAVCVSPLLAIYLLLVN